MEKHRGATRSIGLRILWQSGVIVFFALALGFASNASRRDGLSLHARWSPESQLKTADQNQELAISLEEARDLFLIADAVFIDSRDESDYADGHIEGAINLPWHDFESRFAETLAHIPPSTRIITYCDGDGCNLSKELAFTLLAKGYSDVRVLVNGWSRWQGAGLPVTR